MRIIYANKKQLNHIFVNYQNKIRSTIMSDSDVFVNVFFMGQEKSNISMPPTATIADLAKSLKESGFLPFHVSLYNLHYHKDGGSRLKLSETLGSLRESLTSNNLTIIDPSAVIREACTNQSKRLLQKANQYIKQKDFSSLKNQRANSRIPSLVGECFALLGQELQKNLKSQQQKKKALQDIQSFISEGKQVSISSELVEQNKILDLIKSLNSQKQQSEDLLKQKQKEANDQTIARIQTLEKTNSDQNLKIVQMEEKIEQQKRENQKLYNKIQNLEMEKENLIQQFKHQKEQIQVLKVNQKKNLKKGIQKITAISKNDSFTQKLVNVIELETNKKIFGIKELISFEKNVEAKNSFQAVKKLTKKYSILFIARSQIQDKFYGGFTQQQFNEMNKQEFEGCSFLFTFIDSKISYFRIQDRSQKSINVDEQFFRLGYEDLLLQFQNNNCSTELENYSTKAIGEDGSEIPNGNNFSENLISTTGRKKNVPVLSYKICQVIFEDA